MEKWQNDLQESRHITFNWWDRKFIEIHLKSMYSIVARFFSPLEAAEYCNGEKPAIELPFDPAGDQISRKMGRVFQAKTLQEAFWLRPEDHSASLVELLLADRLKTHRICLVAEPYQGKTTYLRHCAYELKNSGRHVQPIYLDIKQSNVLPIQDLLRQHYRSWETIPFKDVVLFIDGLDEAPSPELIRLGNYIADFAVAYPSVSIVASCRTPFFDHYVLKDSLKGFTVYQLLGLELPGIEAFLTSQLGDGADEFMRLVRQKQFGHWLYHPFYLRCLVSMYRENNCLLASKLEMVDHFIEEAQHNTNHRIVLSGSRLERRAHPFTKAVKKLAIAMQLRGTNVLEDNEFQQLFDEKETELLLHNGLVTTRGDRWMFTNAFFQEHLAANYLAGCSLEEILHRISAGQSVRRFA